MQYEYRQGRDQAGIQEKQPSSPDRSPLDKDESAAWWIAFLHRKLRLELAELRLLVVLFCLGGDACKSASASLRQGSEFNVSRSRAGVETHVLDRWRQVMQESAQGHDLRPKPVVQLLLLERLHSALSSSCASQLRNSVHLQSRSANRDPDKTFARNCGRGQDEEGLETAEA